MVYPSEPPPPFPFPCARVLHIHYVLGTQPVQFSYDGVASAQRRLRKGGWEHAAPKRKGRSGNRHPENLVFGGERRMTARSPAVPGEAGCSVRCGLRGSPVDRVDVRPFHPSPCPKHRKKATTPRFCAQGFFAHSFRAFPHCQAREDAASWGGDAVRGDCGTGWISMSTRVGFLSQAIADAEPVPVAFRAGICASRRYPRF